jgi:hypothetical protein
MEQALGLLAKLETRMRDEEAEYAAYIEQFIEQFNHDADTVLDESARTGHACGIVRRKDGAA